MKNSALYAIIAVVVAGAGGGIAFAVMSMNGANSAENVFQPDNSVRSFEHAAGTTEITGTPKRIVVLEWTYAEDLLALGIQPVGVADIANMNKWVQMKELSLSSNVVDVGTRQQPNLEKISELDPDLIIGVQFRHQAIYDDLRAIAPTVIFNPYPAEEENLDHLTEMKQTLMTIAEIVSRRDAGVAAIDRMESSFERAAQKLSASGAKEEFLVVQAYTSTKTDAAEMRIFTANSIPAQIMNRIGVENAWDTKYELYGFSTVGLEALADVDHASFFYVVQGDDNVFANEWDNPVWQNLQFVKEGRTYPLGGDTWLFGGPISGEIFAEKVADALISGNETRTVAHAMGETEITGTPQHIVVLDNISYEILWLLNVEPVGASDIEVRKGWYPQISLSSNVVDVGFSHEPNLEVIAQLEPDLIIGWAHLNSNIYNDLGGIAPTILFDQFPEQGGDDALESTKNSVIGIADALNRHDDGIAIIEKMNAKFDDIASKLASAGLKDKKVVMIDASMRDGNPRLRLYAPNSLPVLTLEQLGLVNIAPAAEEFSRFGSSTISLEVLSTLDDDPNTLLLYAQLPNNDPAPVIFKDNPVWKNLSFVKEGRTYNLGEINMFAGPIQIEKFADAVARALMEKNDVRVIKHAMGETEIKGTPERVVVLYSVYVGDVRALGVQPIGTVNLDFINGWLTPLGYPLSEDVVNVGTPDEPNFEIIAQLEPDLIIGFAGVWSKQTEMYDELNDIAPTLLFDPAPPDTELDESEVAEQNFMAIADTLNRHDQGVAFLENLDAHYEESAKKIEQAGLKGAKVVMVQSYLKNDVPGAFIFAKSAFASLLVNKIGLVTEVPDPTDTSDKWYRTGMEGLTTVDGPDVHLIVTYNAGQYDSNPLERSPLWSTLDAVKDGRAHDIGNTRLFNQIIFAEDIVSRVVDALTDGVTETNTSILYDIIAAAIVAGS